jgi:putative ABC transport system permease protein
VRRFLLRQLRSRPSRTATLGAGILVAAASFVLLTSAVSTSALQVKGTVAKNWKTAYDILVRPNGSYTQLEREQGLVADNYLSGIFGGITMKQWRDVLQIPGVEVAAPIANIGYILPRSLIGISMSKFLTTAPAQLYRVSYTWVADDGLSRYPAESHYLYFTRANRFAGKQSEIREVVPGSGSFPVCGGFYGPSYFSPMPDPTANEPKSPFDLRARAGIFCYSSRSPAVDHLNGWEEHGPSPFPPGEIGPLAVVTFPILVAGIDPVQEARLVGMDQTIVSGRFLGEADQPGAVACAPGERVRMVPIIASTTTFLGERLEASIERLDIPSGTDIPAILGSPRRARPFLTKAPGTAVGIERSTVHPAYERLLGSLTTPCNFPPYESYRRVSPVTYRLAGPDRIEPVPTTNPESVWAGLLIGPFLDAPVENQDTQFRGIQAFVGSNGVHAGVFDTPGLHVVGRFDPQKFPGFSPLTSVPLGYRPPEVEGGDARTRQLLGGNGLLPSQNIGGYLAQPPLMLTTLAGAQLMDDPHSFDGASPKAPISVIRVRVAGGTGPDPVSRERIRRVAQAIVDATGLSVDITAGSSPHPLLVSLPPGKFGRPALTVQEGWTKKGAAVAIIEALDRKSLALFALVLVVCGRCWERWCWWACWPGWPARGSPQPW